MTHYAVRAHNVQACLTGQGDDAKRADMLSLPNLVLFQGYGPALLALAVALVVGAAARLSGRGGAGLAGAAGALAGWAAMAPSLVAAWSPRTVQDFALLPAAGVLLAAAAAPWLRGRPGRWLPALLTVGAGWWLAGSTPARPEFWRVWAVVAVAAVLLGRVFGTQGGRSVATAAALAVGLVVAKAAPAWLGFGAVLGLAAVGAGVTGGAMPAVLVVVGAAVVDLGLGRLVRGGFNAIDLACVLAPVAGLVAAWAVPRLGRRWGVMRDVVGVLVGMAVVAGAVWLGSRAIR